MDTDVVIYRLKNKEAQCKLQLMFLARTKNIEWVMPFAGKTLKS